MHQGSDSQGCGCKRKILESKTPVTLFLQVMVNSLGFKIWVQGFWGFGLEYGEQFRIEDLG